MIKICVPGRLPASGAPARLVPGLDESALAEGGIQPQTPRASRHRGRPGWSTGELGRRAQTFAAVASAAASCAASQPLASPPRTWLGCPAPGSRSSTGTMRVTRLINSRLARRLETSGPSSPGPAGSGPALDLRCLRIRATRVLPPAAPPGRAIGYGNTVASTSDILLTRRKRFCFACSPSLPGTSGQPGTIRSEPPNAARGRPAKPTRGTADAALTRGGAGGQRAGGAPAGPGGTATPGRSRPGRVMAPLPALCRACAASPRR